MVPGLSSTFCCPRYDDVFVASQLASQAKRVLSLASGGSLKGPFKTSKVNV
jgi:hypothetical protein